ncbi:uncharacterized protein LOC131522542 [Onychostoma macrolepis]|uniref:uncharacterized protein LOC131522542 n=1 Tax=Onychostoma macrolepis TaxID=369639 RepID=UPI0027298250|nr:uncharacterized protein LOC131522542 [Onychostoma macrolepis]XP_058604080.1 uncharacterized protein LOC131522542 [Onychostoma macrolepis]
MSGPLHGNLLAGQPTFFKEPCPAIMAVTLIGTSDGNSRLRRLIAKTAVTVPDPDPIKGAVYHIHDRFHMGFRSGMLAGQSSTVISWSANHLEVVLALWAGAKVLLEKEISISIKLVSRWKHKVLQNLLVDGCIDLGLDKTQWTNTSRRHGTQIISDFRNFTLDFKQLGFCASPVFLQTPDLDFQMKCKIYFYLKSGLWTTEQQSSSFSH